MSSYRTYLHSSINHFTDPSASLAGIPLSPTTVGTLLTVQASLTVGADAATSPPSAFGESVRLVQDGRAVHTD